jgi:ABC-type sugar transport system substrate-binding protein
MSEPCVALLLPDGKNPYMQLSAEVAASTAARLGIRLETHFADGDFTQQIRQLHAAARGEQPPRIFLVTPVQEAALHGLSAQLAGRGHGWFWLSRSSGSHDDLRQRFPKAPTCLVSPDQVEAGRIQARQLRALFPSGAHVLQVQGRMTNQSAQLRSAGLLEEVRRSGVAIDFVANLDGNWSAADTRACVGQWLKTAVSSKQRIDAIVCQSDEMATGVLDAIRELRPDARGRFAQRLPILGCDGLRAAGCRLVDEGQLAGTTILPTTTEKALQLCDAYFATGAMPPAEVILPPVPYPDEGTLLRRWRQER